jgi:hypothetical protein
MDHVPFAFLRFLKPRIASSFLKDVALVGQHPFMDFVGFRTALDLEIRVSIGFEITMNVRTTGLSTLVDELT